MSWKVGWPGVTAPGQPQPEPKWPEPRFTPVILPDMGFGVNAGSFNKPKEAIV